MEDKIRIENKKNLIDNLMAIGVKFTRLVKEKSDADIWDGICNSNLYEINEHMLKAYFDDKADFWERSYTYISKNDSKQKIKKYIDDNIAVYFDLIIDIAYKRGIHFRDDERSALSLINNEKIMSNKKERYIFRLKTQISSLESVSDLALWDALLINKLVPNNVHTILKYFMNINGNGDKQDILVAYIKDIEDVISSFTIIPSIAILLRYALIVAQPLCFIFCWIRLYSSCDTLMCICCSLTIIISFPPRGEQNRHPLALNYFKP